MDKYTVLLADDEEEVVRIIMKKIDWDALGFSVIGYANNGVRALEMVEEFQPDVVMTDIKMPYMDGMELANHIKAEFPATKILLFTGFDKFEYAKEAVHLEVEEYILKPVNSAELTDVFTHLKTKLDKEISDKRNTEILQKYYMESLPLLQANFYASLIAGRIREDEIDKFLSDYQISFTGPFFCCLVIHTSSSQVPEGMHPMLLATSVQKQAEEYLKGWNPKCFSYLGNTVLIPELKSEHEISELTDECDRFCKYVRRMTGAVVTVGIGSVCRDILGLSQSYSSAREAVSYRVLYGTSRSINMKEIAPSQTSKSGTVHNEEISSLFKMIRLNGEKDIIKAVEQYLNHFAVPQKSLQQYHIDIMELISALYRFAVNNDIVMEEFSGDVGKLYNSIFDMEPEELKKWLTDTSLLFREKIISARNSSTQSFVSGAKEYVQNNYADEELSLDRICEVLGVSNSYFSTLFKKETGSSFISYLTDYRMDQASRMLIETSEKSYIIAKNVGYTDPNYFSYVFKRRFGVSPSNYRREHTESEE